ncbi:endonuclease (plasmid) [Staphylococcus warneri]|nr:endonuclease [Staphylococcus warneri]
MKKTIGSIGSVLILAGVYAFSNGDIKDEIKSQFHVKSEAKSVTNNGSDKKLLDIKYDPKKYPENYVTVNDNKVDLSTKDKKLIDEKGDKAFWSQYQSLDDDGRSGEVKALVTHKSVEDNATKNKKRPAFDYKTHVAGEYSDGRYDTTKGTWLGEHSNNKIMQLKGYKGYLYNKSHSLAWSLGGDMKNHNLTLGTRSQNVGTNKTKDGGGMGYAEEKVRNVVTNKPNTKVYYKVTPVYKDNELIPRGSHVQAKSINDNGKSINLNTWVFNNEDGVKINYHNGTWKKTE